MKYHRCLRLLLTLLATLESQGVIAATEAIWNAAQQPIRGSKQHILVTAVASHQQPPYHAYLMCLRSPALQRYPTVGQSMFLSDVTNTTVVFLPPGSAEGWHRPPAPMWFVLLRGQARVECPWRGERSSSSPM